MVAEKNNGLMWVPAYAVMFLLTGIIGLPVCVWLGASSHNPPTATFWFLFIASFVCVASIVIGGVIGWTWIRHIEDKK